MSSDTDLEENTDDDNTSDAEEILKTRGIYYITGVLMEDTSLLDIQQDILLKIQDNFQDDLQIIVNSPGGLLDPFWALLAIINFAKSVGYKIHTTGLGTIASVGAMLVAAGTTGCRKVTSDTMIMVHRMIGGTEGNHPALLSAMKAVTMEHKRMIHFWQTHSSLKTKKEIESKLLTEQDNWLLPVEAKKLGIIDCII